MKPLTISILLLCIIAVIRAEDKVKNFEKKCLISEMKPGIEDIDSAQLKSFGDVFPEPF